MLNPKARTLTRDRKEMYHDKEETVGAEETLTEKGTQPRREDSTTAGVPPGMKWLGPIPSSDKRGASGYCHGVPEAHRPVFGRKWSGPWLRLQLQRMGPRPVHGLRRVTSSLPRTGAYSVSLLRPLCVLVIFTCLGMIQTISGRKERISRYSWRNRIIPLYGIDVGPVAYSGRECWMKGSKITSKEGSRLSG